MTTHLCLPKGVDRMPAVASMALSLRFLLPRVLPTKTPANAPGSQFLRGRAVSLSSNIASGSSRELFSLTCRCQKGLEKVFGDRGPVYVCTDPSNIDAEQLSSFLAASNQNCELFPRLRDDGSVVPVNPTKLRRALRHSTVVVALYVEQDDEEECEAEADRIDQIPGQPGRGWLDYWKPRPERRRTLVAFGRATSDFSLTASIYDLAVAPSYQRAGYGSRVLLRIVRELRRKGICDIAVTPAPELSLDVWSPCHVLQLEEFGDELVNAVWSFHGLDVVALACRKFFEKCGFAPDQLNSTTMMYTLSATDAGQSASEIKEYGRKMFLIPPPLTPRASTRILERSRL
ncbi:hypothetical protein AXG93_1860s1080 [Marchantia polymorpha subsp. ruderalis]|uniref:N-acetyltransferase domain-containing protein n=1 Tax=Marchantia polymorpha subsp. ruderalis TaxID=1480154 RepID=A0A176VEH9_MARPO|nr:hypothetical protein AXG93_1860s1080 [Marchantia polymorpha subsp. ruderalis]